MKRRKRTVRRVVRSSARRSRRRNPAKSQLQRAIENLTVRVQAGRVAKKARKTARKSRIRTWGRIKARPSRMVVKRTRTGLTRSPYSRIGFRKGVMLRVNPYSRRRRKRRNPMAMMKRTMNQFKLNQVVPILVGFAGGIGSKMILSTHVIPRLTSNPMTILMLNKWSGLATMAIGALVVAKGRKQMVKSAGIGMIAGGLYDVLGSNFANLPGIDLLVSTIHPKDTSAGLNLGRHGQGYDVVGASNLSDSPEIVGDMDFDDLDI